MFESFLNMKPDLVFLEGFTDVAENAAWWRNKDRTYYDYPNQRINLLANTAIILSLWNRDWKLKLVTSVTKELFPEIRLRHH